MQRLAIAVIFPLLFVSALRAADPTPLELLKESEAAAKAMPKPDTVGHVARDIAMHYMAFESFTDAKRLCETIPKDSMQERAGAYAALGAALTTKGKVDDAFALAKQLPSDENDYHISKLYASIANAFAAKGDLAGFKTAVANIPEGDLQKWQHYRLTEYLQFSQARAHFNAGDLKSCEAILAKEELKNDGQFLFPLCIDIAIKLAGQKKNADARQWISRAKAAASDARYSEPSPLIARAMTLAGDAAGAAEFAKTIKDKHSANFCIEEIAFAQLDMGQITDAERTIARNFEEVPIRFPMKLGLALSKSDPARSQKVLTPHLYINYDTTMQYDIGAAIVKSSNTTTAVKWVRAMKDPYLKVYGLLGAASGTATYRPVPPFDYMGGYR